MERKRVSLAEAFASVPLDATGDPADMGRAAKRARLENETAELRARLNQASASHGVHAATLSSAPLGLREGEAVVRIPEILDDNARRGALRSDGFQWPEAALLNRAAVNAQPYQRSWLDRETGNLNAAALNPTMRLVNLLAHRMNRKPVSFFNMDAVRAMQEAEARARARAQNRDIDRKIVDAPEKVKQLAALEAQRGKVDEELNTLSGPQFVSSVPLPPYSDGTEVTRTLLDAAVEDGEHGLEPLLHAWPREPRQGAPDAVEQTYGQSYQNAQLHSIFALAQRVKLYELALRLGEPDNADVLQAGRAKNPMTTEDRAEATAYISTAWAARYDASELTSKDDDGIRELFFATWAYDMLRNQLGGAPMDLALASWHGAAALSLFANYLVREDAVQVDPNSNFRALADILQSASRGAIIEANAEPPAYVNRAAWQLLDYLLGQVMASADQKLVNTQRDILGVAEGEIVKLQEAARYLASPEALASDSLDANRQTRQAARAALLHAMQLASAPRADSVLDTEALAVIHAVSVQANIRPPTPASDPLVWTNKPTRRAILASSEKYLELLRDSKGNLASNAALVSQFAVLGRNIMLIQSRSDVPQLRTIAHALGWVDVETLRATLRVADAAVRVMSRDHLIYLSMRGALAPLEHWKTLAPFRIGQPRSIEATARELIFYTLATLPGDLETMVTDLNQRVFAAVQEGVLPEDTLAHIAKVSRERPIVLLYEMARAQNTRDQRRRAALQEQRALIVRDIDAARRILAEISAELPSAGGLGAISADTYTQTPEWIQQPFVGGMSVLSGELLGAIDEARAGVDRWVPSLKGAPLQLLTEHFDSGLAVEFGKFIAVLAADSDLTHERDFRRAEHFQEVPKRFHAQIKSLQRFSYGRGPGGSYHVYNNANGDTFYGHAPGSVSGTDAYVIY